MHSSRVCIANFSDSHWCYFNKRCKNSIFRKEARRRELKKNKKQRILVRNAVLKGKRPQEIIEELEKIDDMEYNPVTPCPLNQKVMSEKRRKLMETWDRVFEMYKKDAPDQFEDVQKYWAAYQVHEKKKKNATTKKINPNTKK